MLNIIEEGIRSHSSKDENDCTLDQFEWSTNEEPNLPYIYNFFKTSQAVILKVGDVRVTILLSRDWSKEGGYKELCKLADSAPDGHLHRWVCDQN